MTEERRELAMMEKGNGNLIIAAETEYEGRRLIDVREYWREQSGTLRPTRKGMSFRPERFSDLLDFIREAAENYEAGRSRAA